MKTGDEKSHAMLLKKMEPNGHASLKWQRNEATDGEFDCNCFSAAKLRADLMLRVNHVQSSPGIQDIRSLRSIVISRFVEVAFQVLSV